MSIPFRQAPFKTSGGTTARSLDDWFGDVVHVVEFANLHTGSGSFGDGNTAGDDAACFQAAFDLAFGTAAAPHGETNKHLNRPVSIPAGRFSHQNSAHSDSDCRGAHLRGRETFDTNILRRHLSSGVYYAHASDRHRWRVRPDHRAHGPPEQWTRRGVHGLQFVRDKS